MIITTHSAISFHEATILSIKSSSGILELDLEGVRVEDRIVAGELSIIYAGNLLRENSHVQAMQMENSDNEILDLRYHNRDVRLIVEWISYLPRSRATVVYDIQRAKLSFESLPSE